MVITIVSMPKATAQIPFLQQLPVPTSASREPDNRVVSDWVHLDGRRLFQIAAPRNNLAERKENIEQNLQEITRDYVRSSTTEPAVQVRTLNGLPVIYINNRYLMTITPQDASQGEGDAFALAESIKESLKQDLQQARQERQTQFFIDQAKIAGAIAFAMLIASWSVTRWQRRTLRNSVVSHVSPPTTNQITTQLDQQQQRHLQEVKRRMFQFSQLTIWGGGNFLILGLFPYTRSLQVAILSAAQIPLRLAVVGVGTYVAIRLTYALIDRFTTTLIKSGALFTTDEASERLQLRVSTFSGVTKSIATIVCVVVSLLLALVSLGIDVVPLLAGASLVGVAVSLASQNLIKDAINGFLIILEDQYALGDVINVGNYGGLVENLNLRMTQIRDSEGRLITIPNSEIKIVANLSSRWSRADLSIPVDYQADIDQALQLIGDVALKMDQDPLWQKRIIETPQVLGVDNFGDRGLIIRVWIKTQPLKQWDVAREYRRRLKIAFDQAGIFIPVPQQAIWVNENPPVLHVQENGKGVGSGETALREGFPPQATANPKGE
jgi:small conductance mechanosensitive channel